MSARSLVDRHPNSNGTNAGSNPAGRSIEQFDLRFLTWFGTQADRCGSLTQVSVK